MIKKQNNADLQNMALTQQMEIQKQQAKNFNLLLEKGIPAIEKYLNAKLVHYDKPRFKYAIGGVCLILLIIVIGSMFLVFNGLLGADAFTFLMGIIVGYLLTFFKEMLFSND